MTDAICVRMRLQTLLLQIKSFIVFLGILTVCNKWLMTTEKTIGNRRDAVPFFDADFQEATEMIEPWMMVCIRIILVCWTIRAVISTAAAIIQAVTGFFAKLR